MSQTGFHDRGGIISRTALAIAGLVGALGVALAVWLMANRHVPEGAPAQGLRISLAVEPFEVADSVDAQWDPAGFADSLASQLSVVPGIHAAANSSNARYVLRGNVTIKDGRLILATRLGRDGERDTIWTATFWRSTTSGGSVLADVASAVAEAVMSESVKETLGRRPDRR